MKSKEGEAGEVKDNNESYQAPHIFIDQLFRLHSKGIMYDEDEAIRDHVNVTIFGGNDTTGITLSNAILFIAVSSNVHLKK